MLAGLQPSIGSVGNALDNGLAETTIGLHKTECVREGSPFRNGGSFRTLADIEDATRSLGSALRGLCTGSAAEAEAEYYARVHTGKNTSHQ